MNPLHQHGTKFLTQEKSAYQEHISMPTKSDISKNPHGNYKWHRYMNGQVPLQREALHISSPISEGDIQQENEDGDEN